MLSVLSTEWFWPGMLGFVLGVAVIFLVFSRRSARERLEHAAALEQLTETHRTHMETLEEEGRYALARVHEQLEQLRTRHREQLHRLEQRLEHQLELDPHHWLARAQALRVEGRQAAGTGELYAGLHCVRTPLSQAFVEMALHHFVVRVGLSVAAMAAHLFEAERCVQIAALLEPDDRIPAHVAEDIAAELDALRIERQGDAWQEHDVTATDEQTFLGEPDARVRLIEKLTADARAADGAGRFIIAQRLAQRALTIALHEYGAAAAATVEARRMYACTLVANGWYEDAQQQIDVALRSSSEVAATALRMMRASVLAKLGEWQSALSELDALLILRERELGAEHCDTLAVRRERALALSALGHGEAALLEIDAVLAVLDLSGDPEGPDITCARAARAEILHALERHHEALTEVERIAPIAERIFGVEHPIALHVRGLRVLILHGLKRHDEALDEVASLLATQTYVFGAQHPLVLQSAGLRDRIEGATEKSTAIA